MTALHSTSVVAQSSLEAAAAVDSVVVAHAETAVTGVADEGSAAVVAAAAVVDGSEGR